ncbi:MAG: secondary thiamine-phosphate synthase enzyme YjbQ [Methanomicrobiales archaeon]
MFTRTIALTTHGEGEIVDLTPDVREVVASSGVCTGLVHVFVTGSTAAITTIEYESGVLEDLRDALSRIAPDDIPYAHDRAWGDGNGRSHVKAAVVGPSVTVPLVDGALQIGTWQQIVFLELDVRSTRDRTVICSVMGTG